MKGLAMLMVEAWESGEEQDPEKEVLTCLRELERNAGHLATFPANGACVFAPETVEWVLGNPELASVAQSAVEKGAALYLCQAAGSSCDTSRFLQDLAELQELVAPQRFPDG